MNELRKRAEWIPLTGSETCIYEAKIAHLYGGKSQLLHVTIDITDVPIGKGPAYRIFAMVLENHHLRKDPSSFTTRYVPPLHWTPLERRNTLLHCDRYTNFRIRIADILDTFGHSARQIFDEEAVDAIIADSFFRLR